MTVPSGPATGSIPTQNEPRREVVTWAESMSSLMAGSMNVLSSCSELRRVPAARSAGRAQRVGRGRAAVDRHDLAGHVGGVVGEQERDDRPDLIRRARSPERRGGG